MSAAHPNTPAISPDPSATVSLSGRCELNMRSPTLRQKSMDPVALA